MTDRGNIIDKIKKLKGDYHSAILTTYTFDPTFFTDIYMAALKQKGIANVIVMVDAGCLDAVLADPTTDRSKICGYTIVRQQTRSGLGVFHPKMALLVGEKLADLFIGSGNLTYSGHSLNDEVWSHLSYSEQEPNMARIFNDVWAYYNSLALPQLPNEQLRWVKENSKWMELLDENCDRYPTAIGEDKREYRLLLNNQSHSIFSVLVACASDKPYRLSIVSPFYDTDVNSIKGLATRLGVEEVHMYLENGQGRVPQDVPSCFQIHDWLQSYKVKENHRHLHAKLFQIETSNGTYLLLGSANATRNALGMNPIGYNEEASLLIHSPQPFNFLESFGIFSNSASLAPINLTPGNNAVSKRKKEPLCILIRYAQWADKKLTLHIEGDVQEGILRVHTSEPIDVEIKDFSIPITGLKTNPQFISIIKPDGETSNICHVTDEDEVLRCNPDRRNARLRKLMSSMSTFTPELSNLLQHISWDNTEEEFDSHLMHKATKQSNQTDMSNEERVLSPELYYNFSSRIKSQTSRNPNLMIADLLSMLFRREKTSSNNEISDVSEDERIASRIKYVAPKEEDEQIAEKQLQQLRLRLKLYCKTYNTTYAHYLPSEVWKDDVTIEVRLNDFSRMTVISGIMLAYCGQGKGINAELRDLYISAIAVTPVAMRKGWAYEDPYRKGKMEGLLKEYVRFTLMVLIHLHWHNDKRDYAYLLMLNTMRMMCLVYPSDNGSDLGLEAEQEMERIIDQLVKDADNHNITIDNSSLALLKNAFDAFAALGRKTDEDKKRPQSELEIGSIIRLSKVGFALVKSIQPYNPPFVKVTLLHPAFPFTKEHFCGSKVVILSDVNTTTD